MKMSVSRIGTTLVVLALVACTSAKKNSDNFAKNKDGSRSIASVRYDGPGVDVNLINHPPEKYGYCDRYSNASAREYKACIFGRDEAERVAERYGGGNGRVQGYLRGYAWGLHKTTQAYENDASEMDNGARAVDGLGGYMQSGLDAGIREGQSQGQSRGNSDAIDRFQKIVNTGRNPDATVRVPETTYEGVDNGYETYVGQVPTAKEIAQKELSLGELPVYTDWDATYLGEKHSFTVWDMIFDDGIYAFESAYWYDPQKALNAWFQMPLRTRGDYDNLNIPPLYRDLPPVAHPSPTPSGVPVAEPQREMIDLQAIFRDSYGKSYSYYVSYYFSSKFYEFLDMGQLEGETVGVQIGKRVAYYRGLERAFNKKFKESSKATFRDAFVGSYTSTFNSTFADYNSNPKLSLSFKGITESEKDGIFQPGEAFSCKFDMKNVGGVGTPLSISVSGDIIEGKVLSDSIGRLMSKNYTTAEIAKIDPRIPSRSNARILLNVNGLTDDYSQQILKMMQFSSADARVDVVAGNGEITANVTNMATVRTPGLVAVTLKLNGADVITQQVGFVEAGATTRVVLPYANIDPMKLINGDIGAQVILKMGDAITDTGELSLHAEDRTRELAAYFNALINGRGFVPAGQDRSARVGTVSSQLLQANQAETQRYRKGKGNPWKDSPNSTIIGKVVRQFHSLGQSEDALVAYDTMGRSMWADRKNLKKFLFWGAKRKSYEKLCKELIRGKP